jgi:Flp pilus assembly protein TadD
MAEKKNKEKESGGKASEEKAEEKEERKKAGKDGEAGAGGAKTYICITCEKTFEVEPGDKPRCPKCMSIHSVEPYVRRSIKLSRQNLRFAAILVILLAAAVGAYFIMQYKYKPDKGDLASRYVLTHEQLVSAMGERGIAAAAAVDPFAAGEDLKAFAEKNAKGISSAKKAESLYQAFLDFKNKGGYVPFVPRQPRPGEPMNAGEAFEAVKKKDKTPLYSLELALLLVKAARDAGLNAVVARVDDYKGLKAPLDPSGNVGHFVAALYDDDSFQGKAVLYDLHQAKTMTSDVAAFTPLLDLQAAAAFMGHEAFYLSGVKFDSTGALAKMEDALSLHPASAELHSLKGLIYIASGGIEEGKQQIRKALTIRTDAQRVLKWGAILMAEGDEEAAVAEIRKAIDMKDHYAMAHATLAMALLSMGEGDEARRELDRASEIDPTDPLIPLYEANYYIERGQVGKAIEFAEDAYERSYGDPQVGMLLAALYEQTGEKSRMAKVLDDILENENIPDELKATIKDRFRYEPGDVEEDDEELLDDGDMDFELGSLGKKEGGLLSSPTIGGKASAGSLDDEELEDEELEGDALKLELGTPKSGLLTGKGSGMDLELR